MIDFELEIAVVILADRDRTHFIDKRHDVMKRAHGLEDGRIGRTDKAPGSSEEQRVFDGEERDATIIESRREKPIVTADAWSG